MIDYLNTHAEDIILIVVIFLTLFSMIVFVGAIYSRWMLQLSEKKKKKIREDLSELVIKYTLGDVTFDVLKRNLSTKTDYSILLQISNELEKSLEGDEAMRLKRIINIPQIRNYFISRFESGNPLEQAKACLYFSRKTRIKQTFLPLIENHTASEHPMLAYAACMALINHGDVEQKKNGIRNLLSNKGLSNQALNDVFSEFQQKSSDDREAESKLLMKLIDEREYSDDRTALMIHTLGELGFFESAGFLLNEFLEIPDKDYSPDVIVAFINVLSSFGMEEILDRLYLDFISSEFSEVREAIAKALGVFTKKESIPYLKWLLVDPDFYVRFYAAKSLSLYPEIDLRKLSVPTIEQAELNELIGEVESIRDGGY